MIDIAEKLATTLTIRLATAKNMMELERAAADAIAEIEHLGKELESANRVANDWARQNVELRAENERLRGFIANLECGYKGFRDTAEAEYARLHAEIDRRGAEEGLLRGLLREGLRPWPLAVSDGDGSNMRSWRDDWERRVREALGEEIPR